MRKIKFLISIFLLVLFPDFSTANKIVPNFFPLKTGNLYIYDVHIGEHPYTWHITKRVSISSEAIISGKRYFYLDNNFPDHYANSWVRRDSVTGSLYKYDSSNSCTYYQYEKLLDSFVVDVNDTIRNCSVPPFACLQNDTMKIFGNITAERYFYYTEGGCISCWTWRKTFAENFGMIKYSRAAGGLVFFYYTLLGCVIDGVAYGDTTVGITKINQEIPQSFNLYQNYPNPFNPRTIIRYDLKATSYVVLNVFDTQGRQITNLISEKQTPGTYEAEFDASNLASGIYFYTLKTDNFSGTKRMILIK